jgi:hypothetical protein
MAVVALPAMEHVLADRTNFFSYVLQEKKFYTIMQRSVASPEIAIPDPLQNDAVRNR